MALDKKPDAEPIRGYKLIEPLGTGGFGEVWKCEAPGGIFKAIKFVYGNLNGLSSISKKAEDELRAVQHIKSIRHPFLLSIDRVENIQGELVIVTELADQNLHQVLTRYQSEGQRGVPRQELLFYLREAAEVIDLLNIQSNLQHLDIKPRNIFLVSNHVKVADFGLVQSLSHNQPGAQLGAITPLYAAPELFLGQLSQHCDQYSLAIVYQELLTGTLPFDGKNTRQLLMQHTQTEPDLHALPAAERPVIARALHKNPNQRFASCMDFVRALQAESSATPAPLPRSEPYINVGSSPELKLGVAETQSAARQDTEKWRAKQMPTLPADVLPDYRFVENLAKSPLIETWKSQPLEGKPQLVHFVYGCTISDPRKIQDLGVSLRSLQHPGLIPLEMVHGEPGRLILDGPVIKETLRDRFQECVALKKPGIMRNELVDYLRAAAEVLDYLYQQHSIEHLNLNPRNLVLDHGWMQIAEFGLAQLAWLPSGQDVAQRNARYSAPELFEHNLSRSCDQYSLALIYAEMLTGQHPFQGQNPKRRGQPDLEKLSATDRDIIARALHADPAQRWPSATEMALALEGTHPELHVQQEDQFASLLQVPREESGFDQTASISDHLHDQIAALLSNLGAEVSPLTQEQAPVLSEQEQILEHRLQVGMPLGSARKHLEPFVQELGAKVIHQNDAGCTLHLPLPGTFWQRWRNREPSLEVKIQLARVNALSATPIEVRIWVRTWNVDRAKALETLEHKGLPILETLRKQLLISSEKRTQDRLLWPHTLQVVPVYPDGTKDDPIDCRGKDISFSGMGLYLPHELDTPEVILEIPNDVHPPTMSIPATLVRARRCADGWYDVGALFHLPALRKSLPGICVGS